MNDDDQGIERSSGRKVCEHPIHEEFPEVEAQERLIILPVVPTRRGLLGLFDGTSRHLP